MPGLRFDKIRVQELYELLSQSEQEQNVTQEEISAARHHLQNLQVRKDEISKQIMQVEVEISAMDEVAQRSKEEAERYQTEQVQLTQSVEQKRLENSQIDEQEQQLSLDLTTLEEKAGGLSETKQSADAKVKVRFTPLMAPPGVSLSAKFVVEPEPGMR